MRGRKLQKNIPSSSPQISLSFSLSLHNLSLSLSLQLSHSRFLFFSPPNLRSRVTSFSVLIVSFAFLFLTSSLSLHPFFCPGVFTFPIMEWVHELFATAVVAVLFSFVVAKLVSVAMAGDDVRDSESEPGKGVDRVSVAEDMKLEARLSSRGSESEKGVEFVQGTEGKVDRFEEEVVSMEEDVEPVRRRGEIGAERDEAVKESSVAVELPAESKEEEEEEESVGASELIVEKEGECRSGGAKEGDHLPLLEGKDEESQPHEPKCSETARAEQSEHEQEQIDKEKEVFRVDGDDDDDDGWEGIERSELEKKFAAAAKYVDPANMDDRVESVGGDVKMQLYGLRKVATEGPCHEPQPMAFMVSARAKWNAWQRLGNMSPDVAMERYISLLAENIPDWDVARTTDENKLDVAMPGAQDYNLSTISCDQLKCTNLREPSMASVTVQIDPNKDENQ